jgi:hypothetical protein
MAGERPESSSPQSSARSGGGEPERGRPERYGPVLVAKHLKDDGRALIIYTHAGEPEQ